MASGVGTHRGEYPINGVVVVSQVRPRHEQRGRAGDMGREPVLAAFKRDEVLREPRADRGLEPKSMAQALGQSGSGEAI